MAIPTGFYSDLTKNYYGIDPASSSEAEIQASESLWENFLTQVPPTDEPYFNILSSSDESTVDQALISIASSYMSPLSETAQTDLNLLAEALVANRGAALSNLTSTDPQTVQTLLTNLISSQLSSDDPFITTLLPSIAQDIATENTEYQKTYFNYLANQLQTTYLSGPNALSPEEVSKRQLTFKVFETMLSLLTTMSDSQVLSANSEQTLVDAKQQYVTMMQKLFMYEPTGAQNANTGAIQPFYFQDPTTGKITSISGITLSTEEGPLTRPTFSDDPSKYNLGYGNITLQDVFNYVYTNAVAPLSPLDSQLISDAGVGNVSALSALYPTQMPSSTIASEITSNFTASTPTADDTLNILRAFLVKQGAAQGVAPSAVDMTQQSNLDALGAYAKTLSNEISKTTQGTTTAPPTQSCTFDLDSGIWKTGSTYYKNSCAISVTKDPTSGVLTVTATFDQPTTSGNGTWTNGTQYVYTQQVTPPSNNTQSPENLVMAALQSTFYSAYADAVKAGWVQLDSENPTTTTDTSASALQSVIPELKIPSGFEPMPSVNNANVGFLYPASSTSTATDPSATAANSLRTQTNQVLNNYLQNMNSQISLLNDREDTQSQMQDAASTERSETINIVETILQQLKDLISAIYSS